MSDIHDVFGVAEDKMPKSVSPTASVGTPYALSAGKRYREGYLVAKAVVSFGGIVRFILCGFGGLMCFTGFASCDRATSSYGPAGASISIMLLLGGVLVGIFGWIAGTLIMANGQLIKSSLDTAVHGSPFLSVDEKASVMSL